MLVKYESLVRGLKKLFTAVYEFINEPIHKPYFDDVKFDAFEFDKKASATGLHEVSAKIAPKEGVAILSLNLFKCF